MLLYSSIFKVNSNKKYMIQNSTDTVTPQSLDPHDYAFLDLYAESPDIHGDFPGTRQLTAELGLGDNVLFLPLGKTALTTAQNRHPSTILNIETRPELPEVITSKFEVEGFVYKSPCFANQCLDTSRTDNFAFNLSGEKPGNSPAQTTEFMSEIDGLRDLQYFLQAILRNPELPLDPKNPVYTHQVARSLLNSLTFIGSPELSNAVNVIGSSWLHFLENHTEKHLFVVAGISNSSKYPDQTKSDKYILTQIEQGYKLTQRREIGERFHTNLKGLEQFSPDDVKIVVLDDWSLSGQQIGRVISDFMGNTAYRKYLGAIDLNFVVASGDKIRHGTRVQFQDSMGFQRNVILPTKAVYKANQAEISVPESGNVHITGLHSSANLGFTSLIDSMYRQIRSVRLHFPALAAIRRNYTKS
jgi:hypothetical protein